MEIVQLDIGGMTCAACVRHVEKGITKGGGVDTAQVNLATEQATISYDPSVTNLDELIKRVVESGYEARKAVDMESRREEKRKEERRLAMSTGIAAALSAPLLLAMVAMLAEIPWLMFLHNPILQLALATPVQFWIGWRFYRGAFASLKAASPGMDVLVALGTSAAYGLSIFNAFIAPALGHASNGLYFESSAVIITLVLLGKLLESRAKGRSSEAIRKLMGLQPKQATVLRDGVEMDIPIADLVVGDRILVRPGDRIPVDGTVVEGSSALDESTITGESMPVEKSVGDTVLSGTMNSYGSLWFEAERVGKDSMIQRIIAVVEEAQGSKAPIQLLADKIAAVFVPVVLVIAVVTFLIHWLFMGDIAGAWISSVAVLVIACPCALGLATPTAIMVGTGMAAQSGILIRNGEILQRTGEITAVLLDKTGTITRGTPELKAVLPLPNTAPRLSPEVAGAILGTKAAAGADGSADAILDIAAALEKSSEHPLARAVTRAAEGRTLPACENFSMVPGNGVSGTVEGKRYHIGTESFLTNMGIDCSPGADAVAEREAAGETVLSFADESRRIALISVADTIKDSSAEGIADLASMGLDVFMMTGDNEGTARAIGAQAGIAPERIFSRVLPEEKAARVAELQKRGYVVAMAGDGVNDAPALATADTAIAMAQGSDIAMETADITLMRGDLRDIPRAVRLSRATMAKIKQNLFWAFFYNSVGIPFAAIGLLNPIIAGTAMAFSSVSVVSNSLLLKRFNPSRKTQGKGSSGGSASTGNNLAAGNTIEHKTEKEGHMSEVTVLNVSGMSCNHCKMAVEKAASSVEGVSAAQVDLEKGQVSFQLGSANLDAVKSAISEAGYEPA